MNNNNTYVINEKIISLASKSLSSGSIFLGNDKSVQLQRLIEMINNDKWGNTNTNLALLVSIAFTKRGIFKNSGGHTKTGEKLLSYIKNEPMISNIIKHELRIRTIRYCDLQTLTDYLCIGTGENKYPDLRQFYLNGNKKTSDLFYKVLSVAIEEINNSAIYCFSNTNKIAFEKNSNFGVGQDLYLSRSMDDNSQSSYSQKSNIKKVIYTWDARYCKPSGISCQSDFEKLTLEQQGYFHDLRSMLWTAGNIICKMAANIDVNDCEKIMSMMSFSNKIREIPYKKAMIKRAACLNIIKIGPASNLFESIHTL